MDSEINSFSKIFMNQIVEPLDLFVAQFRTTNKSIATKTKQLFLTADANAQKIQSQSDQYLKNLKNSEKIVQSMEKTMKQIEKGSRSEYDLQHAAEKSVEFKIAAEESLVVYKKLVEDSNKYLDTFDKEFKQLFEDFDLNEESRVKYSRNSVGQMIKQLSQFNQQQANTDKFNEDKFKELENRIGKTHKQNSYELMAKQVE